MARQSLHRRLPWPPAQPDPQRPRCQSATGSSNCWLPSRQTQLGFPSRRTRIRASILAMRHELNSQVGTNSSTWPGLPLGGLIRKPSTAAQRQERLLSWASAGASRPIGDIGFTELGALKWPVVFVSIHPKRTPRSGSSPKGGTLSDCGVTSGWRPRGPTPSGAHLACHQATGRAGARRGRSRSPSIVPAPAPEFKSQPMAACGGRRRSRRALFATTAAQPASIIAQLAGSGTAAALMSPVVILR